MSGRQDEHWGDSWISIVNLQLPSSLNYLVFQYLPSID